MSNSDDAPKPVRTLIGQPVPNLEPKEPAAPEPPRPAIVLPPGGESTMPMGSSALRADLERTLAAGPAAAAAAIAAAKAGVDPAATAPMGSAAIAEIAAAAAEPARPSIAAIGSTTAKGTPPSPQQLAEAIAKAANAHADRQRPPTGPTPAGSPVGVVAQDYALPAVARVPTPAHQLPPDSMFARPAPAAPQQGRPPTNPNPVVDPAAFAAKPGSNPSAAAYDPAAFAGAPAAYGQPSYAVPPAEPRMATEVTEPTREPLREVAVENYEITAEIARGGMGRILSARDVRLHRQVAIKQLLGNNADFKARFERETLITARLQHPAIVPIYDAGRWPTGELFYTMKLVAGRPLEASIHDVGGMSERLALLPNMIAVAEALAYAHSHNVVHRDLKPANILVGDFGETIVIDWGLAKDLSTNDAAEPAGPFRSAGVSPMGATVAGSVMGTPAYMPLEQGRGLQVDARADVYAIGAVLYHVLSKRPPYDGPDGMTILQALLKAPPPPLAEIAPDVPPELATIVAKAMAREPEHRYPTARELVEDLRRFQNGQMVGVHRYTSRELFRRWAKKHKGALAVAALSFVVLVVVGVVAISGVVSANREAQRERDIAVEQSRAAEANLARAERSEARARKSELAAADQRDRQRFARERRVELDHFAHTKLAKCADCHPTDPKTFSALAGHPGHDECRGCHDEKLMEGVSNDPKCAFCHTDRVAATKDHSSMRACDDGAIRAIKAVGGKIGRCFPHDLKAHRFDDANQPLQCTTCHAVLADKTKWGAKSYKSLLDLDRNTIIGQGPMGGVDAMHKACTTGCHAHDAQTGQASGTPACAKCHPKREL